MWSRKQSVRSRGALAHASRRSPRFGVRPLEALEGRALLSSGMHALGGPGHADTTFRQTNLVSNLPGVAAVQDPNLVNPWGLAANAKGPWWVSDNGTGLSTLYNGAGATQALVVGIPSPGDPTGGGTPTGIVAPDALAHTSDFVVSADGKSGPAAFLFATEDGTISGWSPAVDGAHAVIAVDHSAAGAIYKGLALASSGGKQYIYATDFHAGKVEVYDASFAPHTFSAGQFTDRHIPAGFAPFGIQAINGHIFVTYAKQDADRHDDLAGQGLGFVDEFSTSGRLVARVATRGPLNSPWGLAVAPSTFGRFAGDLLVGNFGDGRINAYKMERNGRFEFEGQLRDASGKGIQIDGLWALAVGNGAAAGSAGTVYFTAGLNGEQDGLFGTLTPSAKKTGMK